MIDSQSLCLKGLKSLSIYLKIFSNLFIILVIGPVILIVIWFSSFSLDPFNLYLYNFKRNCQAVYFYPAVSTCSKKSTEVSLCSGELACWAQFAFFTLRQIKRSSAGERLPSFFFYKNGVLQREAGQASVEDE